ncbi:MAG: response regulator [Candidatus Magnetobacterium sp. LHC-1]
MVEDDPADIDLMREGLHGAKVYVNLHVVMDGVEAMAFLRKEGAYGAALQPDLILLDLNLPKKDGRDVLREIKSDEKLKKIPVIILTTSDAETDILRSYNLGANSYVTKPVGFEKFVKVVNTIEDFWFTVVKLPPK